MRAQKSLIILSSLTAVLAAIAAAIGLFSSKGPGPFSFINIHGQSVQLYGVGLYQYDTLMIGSGFRGADAVTLFIFIPILMGTILSAHRSGLRRKVLLVCSLTYFLYNSLSLSLAAAYNSMILVYILMLAASLFGLILAYTQIDYSVFDQPMRPGYPSIGISRFLYISGTIVSLLWASDIVINLIRNTIPALVTSYTTIVTYVLDLGIVMPSVLLGGYLAAKRHPVGFPLSISMLFLCAAIGVSVVAQTISQLLAGVDYTPVQFVLFIIPFILMSGVAVAFLIKAIRHLPGNQ